MLPLLVNAPPSVHASFFFFFNDTATTEIYTLSLHDALPICVGQRAAQRLAVLLDGQLHAQIRILSVGREGARHGHGAGELDAVLGLRPDAAAQAQRCGQCAQCRELQEVTTLHGISVMGTEGAAARVRFSEQVACQSKWVDRKSTRLNSSHLVSRMPSSACKKKQIHPPLSPPLFASVGIAAYQARMLP